MAPSSSSPPVDCTVDFNTDSLAGKTAVVTGGATGIGQAYVRALHAVNVTVVFGDKNASAGERLSSELTGTKFVPCDVTRWEDQVRLFEQAAEFGGSGKVHYVIANAGMTRSDDVFAFSGPDQAPQKPDLSIIDVNTYGVLYTTKLALHYFMSQNGVAPGPAQEDTCLVLISSGAGFLDVPRSPQYCSTKWAVRGIMHSLRRTAFYHGSRVNVIAPWYVRTSILPKETFDHVQSSGVEFATLEDAGQCALRILSDRGINGRTLFLSPRKWAPRGYLDLNLEEYEGNELLQEIQADQVKGAPVELGLFG